MAGIAGAEHRRPVLFEPRRHAGEHLQVNGRITHDAALADLLAAGFELRLDQHKPTIVDAGAF